MIVVVKPDMKTSEVKMKEKWGVSQPKFIWRDPVVVDQDSGLSG